MVRGGCPQCQSHRRRPEESAPTAYKCNSEMGGDDSTDSSQATYAPSALAAALIHSQLTGGGLVAHRKTGVAGCPL